MLFRSDWEYFLTDLGIDVIKMHGRESLTRLRESLEIVKKYAQKEKILFNHFNDFIEETNLKDKPIDIWRNKIKNCKFDCWDCNFCDQIYTKKDGQQYNPLINIVASELVNSVNYDNQINIPGLTSKRVQNLLFGIGRHIKKYMEIGSAMGATAAAVGYNDHLEVNCIDDWKEDIQPQNNFFVLPENTKNSFDKNTKHIKNLRVHHTDFNSLDISKAFIKKPKKSIIS